MSFYFSTISAQESERVILATTTSTHDSGLLEFILPEFTAIYGIEVDVIAVGTGQALKIGESGDADVLLVHAREREDEFIDAGYGLIRYDVMYNDFVLLGPADDTADVRGMPDIAEAFIQIMNQEVDFVSRGDDSGTHIKEQSIWAMAEREPDGGWYQSVGQGMGATLNIANELQAYTISDRGTYISRVGNNFDLEIIVEGDSSLFNPYGVILVNPDLNDQLNTDGAIAFIHWLIAPDTQAMIAEFELDGEPLFVPNSIPYRLRKQNE